jgi:hypothetical protein
MKKDANQPFVTFRTLVVFFVGVLAGMMIKPMGRGQEVEPLLPPDSPDFPGWNRPFLNAGFIALHVTALFTHFK